MSSESRGALGRIVGAGHSQLSPTAAMRARDVSRPREGDLVSAASKDAAAHPPRAPLTASSTAPPHTSTMPTPAVVAALPAPPTAQGNGGGSPEDS